MIDTVDEWKSVTAVRAREYGDRIIDEKYGDDNAHIRIDDESIDTGVSGDILFLMELYEFSGDRKYLDRVDRVIEALLCFCRENASGNYALYTGRSGVVYVLIQRYLSGAGKRWIDEAVILMTAVSEEYLYSAHTSDYLYDGRAGTLLTAFHLYLISKEKKMLDVVVGLLNRLLSGANISEEGVYWRREGSADLKWPAGMAYGMAGIRYVLHRIKVHCPDTAFDVLLPELDRYLGSCWCIDIDSWGDFRKPLRSRAMLENYKQSYLNSDPDLFNPSGDPSWAHGAAGILLSLPADKVSGKKPLDLVGKMLTAGADISYDLFNGIAGVGLCLLHLTSVMEDPVRLSDRIGTICELLLTAEEESYPGKGLLHGIPGTIYFLMKALRPDGISEHVLAPFHQYGVEGDMPAVELGIKWMSVKKGLIAKHYPRTIGLLEMKAPHLLLKYIGRASGACLYDDVKLFPEMITKDIRNKVTPRLYDCLTDVCSLEYKTVEFYRHESRCHFRVYLEDILYKERITEDLNRDEEWLTDRVLSISDRIMIVDTKWDWSYPDDFNRMNDARMKKKLQENPEKPPGNFQYVVQISGEYLPVELFLENYARLLLHCFDSPVRLGEAVRLSKEHVQSLPDDVMLTLAPEEISNLRAQELRDILMSSIIYKLRQWIFRNILVMS